MRGSTARHQHWSVRAPWKERFVAKYSPKYEWYIINFFSKTGAVFERYVSEKHSVAHPRQSLNFSQHFAAQRRWAAPWKMNDEGGALFNFRGSVVHASLWKVQQSFNYPQFGYSTGKTFVLCTNCQMIWKKNSIQAEIFLNLPQRGFPLESRGKMLIKWRKHAYIKRKFNGKDQLLLILPNRMRVSRVRMIAINLQLNTTIETSVRL